QLQDEISAIEKELRAALLKAGKGAAQGFDLDDLTYKYYRDSWTKLPDFTALKAEDTGKLPRNLFDLGPRTRDEAFGFVYEGVLMRGNPHAPGDVVTPGFPEVLPGGAAVIPQPPKGAQSSGRRLALAEWIASKDNPLTARVMVNRVCQNHFGRGIVRSTSDFG